MNQKEIKKIIKEYIKSEKSKKKEWAKEGLETNYYDYIAELDGESDLFECFLDWYENARSSHKT